jgi:cytochrome bd ubiquinol oxidase subunit I
MDVLPSSLDLARFQFAFVVVWHFLFPAFTIGLASFLVGHLPRRVPFF